MKVRLGHAVLAAASVAAMLFAVGVSSASAAGLSCKAIKGVGSSLQLIAQTEVWGPEHWATKAGAEECEKVEKVTYEATSSGKGKEQWGDKTEKLKAFNASEKPLAAFIGSDTAASEEQMEKMSVAGGQASSKEGIVAVPVAQSAIAVMVSLPEGCEPETKKAEIKGKALSEEWEKNEAQFPALLADKIKETTSGSKDCMVAPKLHARSSNSGTTAGFKRYFKVLEPTNTEWAAVTATLTKAEEPVWPTAANGKIIKTASTGQALVKEVFEDPGTVGYADLSDAADAALSDKFEVKWFKHGTIWSAIAFVEVEAASFKSPEATGGGSNCGTTAEYKKPKGKSVYEVKPGVDWSESWRTNVTGAIEYPICTLTFDLAWHKYETTKLDGSEGYETEAAAAETGHTVLSYLKWIVAAGTGEGQKIATLTEKHYGALPTKIDEAAVAGVNKTNIG